MGAFAAMLWLGVTAAPAYAGWTAYNDCSPGSGQLTHNITSYELNQSGALVDYATGTPVAAQLQIVNNGATANGSGGPMPAADTDAYDTFNGKVSFANVAYYGPEGWYVDAVVTGLDPAKSYEFATSCNRGRSDYTARWSKFTISDIDSAEQASTPGVQVNSDTSVSFWSGYNDINGHVARWTNIRPGANGSFTVRVEADGQFGHSTREGYAFDGILLRELDSASEPLVNVSNPYADVDWATFGTFKGNLHTHTTNSDGGQIPSAVLDGYQAQNYDFLAVTDHNFVTYPWTSYGRDPVVVGMTDISGNELSSGHHTVSLFSGYASSSADQTTLLSGVAAAGGLSFFAHPGRYAETAQWYANHYLAQPTCIGQEIYNQGDRYPGDRVKWDQVLSILMPNRPVWGFSNDDSHAASHIGLNRTYLLAPSVSHTDARTALETGAFFSTYSTSSTHVPPMLTNVVVDAVAGTITVRGTGYTQVRWISQGTQVATGEALDLLNTSGVAKYVRAELHGAEGIAYSNPFGLLPLGGPVNQAPTVSAGANQTVTLPAVATLAGSASDDNLPAPPAALTLLWEEVSGEGSVTFADSAAAQTTATFSEAGTYVLRLTASDGTLSASDEVTVTVNAAVLPEPASWVAFNDCVFQTAVYKHANATVYNIGNSSPGPANGALRDLASGTVLPVTVTLTQSGGVVWQPDPVTGGSDCADDTDADKTFGGIVSMGGVTYYGSAGWTVDATFAGLDPDGVYEFATSANRNSASYQNRRSVYTLLGADAFHAASTVGVTVDGASTTFNTGDNTANGYVARWVGIRPGADGSFTVRATHAPDAESGNKAYAFDVFRIARADGFEAWAQERGLRGSEDDFAAPNGHGVPRAFEFACGPNLVTGEPLLTIRTVNGRPVIDVPAQDPSSATHVRLVLEATTSLGSAWTLPVRLAADTTGKPGHRDWFETESDPSTAFFRLVDQPLD